MTSSTTFSTAAHDEALRRHDRLAKPPGSLGRLERLGARLAGIAGACPPPVPAPATVVVFAADHGVVSSGVTPWPQAVTAAMVAAFAGGRATINALARQVGAEVLVVDVGVVHPYPASDRVLRRVVRHGTADLSTGPAMTVAEAQAAVDVGLEVGRQVLAGGARCLVTGDMGIGNTTPSAAVVGALTGRPADEVTGRGTGIDDAMLLRKTEIVAAALDRARGLAPLAVAAEVGGLEIAAIAGLAVAGAEAGVPVLVDGVIALAGALLADALQPGTRDVLVAGHRSVEPAASVALAHLGLDPLLDLGMRLGEGTGAVLALPLVQAAARVLHEVATLDELAP